MDGALVISLGNILNIVNIPNDISSFFDNTDIILFHAGCT